MDAVAADAAREFQSLKDNEREACARQCHLLDGVICGPKLFDKLVPGRIDIGGLKHRVIKALPKFQPVLDTFSPKIDIVHEGRESDEVANVASCHREDD